MALAAEHHAATGTVQKALRILECEGLIESAPSYGTFVAER
jgi:DNA-binding transcriptional regulator YhcF (GntR family)